jgi:hypothetical protein
MFKQSTDNTNISNRPRVRVYYEQDKVTKQFKLYEREKFLDSWLYVSAHKTLAEVQEAARSRAITVIEMGLFDSNHRKGMMSWFEEPAPVKIIPEFSSNFDTASELEIENKYLRKIKRMK